MKSDLENYIRRHRREFDSDTPADHVWKQVEKSIPPNRTVRLFSSRKFYQWTAVAAVFLVMLSSVYILTAEKDTDRENISQENIQAPLTNHGALREIRNIAPDYIPQFNRIYQVLETRQTELSHIQKDYPALYEQFQDDLAVLDSSFQLLKNKAMQSPNKDVILQAMIQNLRLQEELLNRQLIIIQQFKNSKKSENETPI